MKVTQTSAPAHVVADLPARPETTPDEIARRHDSAHLPGLVTRDPRWARLARRLLADPAEGEAGIDAARRLLTDEDEPRRAA